MVSKFVISNGMLKSVEEVLHGGSYLPFCSLYIRLLPLLFAYVKWFSDSQSACKIIQVGSMRNDLHAIVLWRIFSSAPIMV